MSNVNIAMSNYNVENAARQSPNALAAAQSNLQSQEIIKEGIRTVQTVQAAEKMAELQRVHRKKDGEGGNDDSGQNDSYEHSDKSKHENLKSDLAPVFTNSEIKTSDRKISFTA